MLILRAFLLTLLLLVACAPQFSPPGMGRSTPQLQDETFISFDGAVLPVRSWLPEGKPQAVIIALHGFNDYSLFISQAAEFFSQNSIAVFAYDQRGFGRAPNRGRWPGRHAFSQDLEVFVKLIHRQFPDAPLFVLGESMGASIVLQTLASEPMQLDGVILAAPAVWGWDAMPWWQVWGLRLGTFIMPWKTFTGQSLKIKASDNRDMLIALGRDPLVIKETRVDSMYGLVDLMQAGFESVSRLQSPALVLYGDKDEVIPKAPVFDTFGPMHGKQQQLVVYKNGYHMLLRDLQADVVWRDIVSWIRDRNAALPSTQQGLSTAP